MDIMRTINLLKSVGVETEFRNDPPMWQIVSRYLILVLTDSFADTDVHDWVLHLLFALLASFRRDRAYLVMAFLYGFLGEKASELLDGSVAFRFALRTSGDVFCRTLFECGHGQH